MTGNFIMLSLARLTIGLGAATGLVAGGALAANIGQTLNLSAALLALGAAAAAGQGTLKSKW